MYKIDFAQADIDLKARAAAKTGLLVTSFNYKISFKVFYSNIIIVVILKFKIIIVNCFIIDLKVIDHRLLDLYICVTTVCTLSNSVFFVLSVTFYIF